MHQFGRMAIKAGQFMLSSNFTVDAVRKLMGAEEPVALETFIRERFSERYIDPVRGANGFTQLATSSLLIETLECFINGKDRTPRALLPAVLPATRRRSSVQQYFIDFFGRQADLKELAEYEERAARLSELGEDDDIWGRSGDNTFYANVRCGILHQGETTNGWRIWDEKPVFLAELLVINPELLLDAVDNVLRDYAQAVAKAPLESALRKNFELKMSATIRHTRYASASKKTHA